MDRIETISRNKGLTCAHDLILFSILWDNMSHIMITKRKKYHHFRSYIAHFKFPVIIKSWGLHNQKGRWLKSIGAGGRISLQLFVLKSSFPGVKTSKQQCIHQSYIHNQKGIWLKKIYKEISSCFWKIFISLPSKDLTSFHFWKQRHICVKQTRKVK